MQAMYDLVGDRIQRSSTPRSSTSVSWTARPELIRFPYTIERGVRFPDEPIELIGFREACASRRASRS